MNFTLLQDGRPIRNKLEAELADAKKAYDDLIGLFDKSERQKEELQDRLIKMTSARDYHQQTREIRVGEHELEIDNRKKAYKHLVLQLEQSETIIGVLHDVIGKERHERKVAERALEILDNMDIITITQRDSVDKAINQAKEELAEKGEK